MNTFRIENATSQDIDSHSSRNKPLPRRYSILSGNAGYDNQQKIIGALRFRDLAVEGLVVGATIRSRE